MDFYTKINDVLEVLPEVVLKSRTSSPTGKKNLKAYPQNTKIHPKESDKQKVN